MKKQCSICGKGIIDGRKYKPTGEIICNSQTCWGEFFINITDLWGRQ